VQGFMQHLAGLNCLPIFYYHYPSQTGLRLCAEQIAQILAVPGVVGIKESTLDLREVEQHIALRAGCPTVFLSGTALNLTQFMQLGGHGAMCPEAVLMPCRTVKAYQAYIHGDCACAREIQKELFAVAPILRGGMTSARTARVVMMAAQDHQIGLPMGGHPQARLKAALNHLCIPTATLVKCPLPELTWFDQHKVNRAMPDVVRFEGCNSAGPVAPLAVPAAPAVGFNKWGTLLPE
jgi:dihydrodipicolinate synthase/N-acetylneuraminate lyase